MDRHRQDWARVSAIVADALEQPEAERAALLDRRCGEDAALRLEVESLIAASVRAGSFLDREALALNGAAAIVSSVASGSLGLVPGRRIGPYRVVREIGHGGMGIVYLASRVDDAFERDAAIKVVRRDGGGDAAVQRFHDERRILASLDHPYIARLIDGGVSDDGLSYFVMEYVEGLPLDRYCETPVLSLKTRLELFLKVCEAVEYAHRRLVIHRDIKSRNILVTADGTPKLLDFGIAKLLDPVVAAAATQTMRRAFTLENASPEQIRGEPMTVTSDVYALGVLLYGLLTGQHPNGASTTTEAEMVKAICDTPPVRPTLAARRELPISAELEWIVLKALRKEPDRRYGSVVEFADDVDRLLTGRPVLAAPDSPGYRARKFVRRHVGAVSAAALVVLSLVGGLTATLWQAQRATEQRARAEQRLQSARRVAQSLLFEVYDAINAVPGATAAKALVLRRAAEQLDSIAAETPDDPAVLEELAVAYHRLASVQAGESANLGDESGALANHKKGLALRQALAARRPEHPGYRSRLAESLMATATANPDAKAALADAQAAVTLTEALVAAQPSEPRLQRGLAEAHYTLGVQTSITQGRAQGVPFFERAANIYQTLYDADRNDGQVRRLLAQCHRRLGAALAEHDAGRAISHMRAAVSLGEDEPAAEPGAPRRRRDLAASYIQLGYALSQQGDSAGALDAYHRALTLREELMRLDANDIQAVRGVGSVLWYIGDLQNIMSRPRDAAATFGRALPYVMRTSSVTNDMVGLVLSGLADARLNLNELDESIDFRRQAVKRHREVLMAQPSSFATRRYLIHNLARLGDTLMRQATATGNATTRRNACLIYQDGLRESLEIPAGQLAPADRSARDALQASLKQCPTASAEPHD